MKKIAIQLLRISLIFLVLLLVTRIFKRPDEGKYGTSAAALFSKGNAPDSTRKQVISQLYKFQDGYTKRDVNQVEPFMYSLYSKDNTLILGTMPGEIYSGYSKATELVKSDWESWGDCRFAMDSANISASGNTAWFSVSGYVKFDLSRLLVIPLRLTGVMVRGNGSWKFQQQQFQFDIDFSFSILASILLFTWLVIDMIILIIFIFKEFRKKKIS